MGDRSSPSHSPDCTLDRERSGPVSSLTVERGRIAVIGPDPYDKKRTLGIPPDALSGLDARFEPVKLLGQGGMGDVYLAHDRQLGRDVAIKKISASDNAIARRLEDEARWTARINHPNVVTVYDSKVVDANVYIISEHIEGDSLDRLGRAFAWTEVLQLGLDLARGLAAAHERGVLHRDIKPSNAILERASGRAKLIDFGVARLVAPNEASVSTSIEPAPAQGIWATPAQGIRAMSRTCPGTPMYQAPELRRRHRATSRSDVYSFGALLYELCTGSPPPMATSVDPIRLQRDDIDSRFISIVNRCLEIDPARRYATAAELTSDLEALDAAPKRLENPYRGLLYFQESHRGFFFGRDGDADAIVEELRIKPFILVVGNSGVGKSSLAHAGVLPRVRTGGMGPDRTWTPVSLVPGIYPLTAISHAIADFLDADWQSVVGRIRRGELSTIAHDLRTRASHPSGTVILID